MCMRDDIHRRLPLARAWKRVVKACVRDAEAPFRAPLLEQAARSELASLRLSVVEDAAERETLIKRLRSQKQTLTLNHLMPNSTSKIL